MRNLQGPVAVALLGLALCGCGGNGSGGGGDGAASQPSSTWYQDADGDGFTDGSVLTLAEPPSGFFAYEQLQGLGDCNDADPAVRPGAADPCGDGVDQDCDGADSVCTSWDSMVWDRDRWQ